MSKENLLKEFDKTTEVGNGGITFETLRNLFIKAIDQTREETIREVEEMLPEEKKLKEYEKTDPNVFTEANIRNLKISFENQAIAPYVSAYNELRQEVLNILNKLKK